MGKAGRWLRSFFVAGRKGKKARDRDRADPDSQSVSSALPTPASTPSAKEKRRWSFRRPAAATSGKVETSASGQGPLASSSSQCFSEAEVHVAVVQDQHGVVAVPEAVAATADTVISPPASKRSGGGDDEESAAAIKIQSAFRSYLARKALCALRGMVKLQAMVRGQLVRLQANMTLRRMQALVDAQRWARAERLRLLEDDGRQLTTTTPRPPPSRQSPQHSRSRKPLEVVERGSEENIKIVEVDDGGEAHGAPRACARRGGSCYSTPLSRTPAKAELYPKVSPTASALTDTSARTLSGRFDDLSFTSASEPSRRCKAWRAYHAPPFAVPFPNYMANTESSRAKARSQSAPRQRPVASEAAASPSLLCGERPPSGSGDPRCRASLDPLDLPGARATAPRCSAGRMERCASRARASASEFGSPSTVMASTTAAMRMA
ncbi:protein IQ-DOMAIN 19-like [Phragmites australis]|uniref:protein IQ-DOMAIN 19-like n=1 Tax=Phragmites australis TaxID=29695 RepID=UPI002D77B8BB|nr:protein IQ-DOMAIN 19-like [Phragmites australis]